MCPAGELYCTGSDSQGVRNGEVIINSEGCFGLWADIGPHEAIALIWHHFAKESRRPEERV